MTIAGLVRARARSAAKIAEGAQAGPTALQWAALIVLPSSYAALLFFKRIFALDLAHMLFLIGFSFSAIWKLLAVGLCDRINPPAPLRNAALPPYTIIAALYHEGAVVDGLVEALRRIDYPSDRLQIIVALEKDDDETLGALAWLNLPCWVEVVVKQPEGPKTKPNALNAALAIATGEHLVVYDAEDRPHPAQIREAASRFARDPDLCYLQAPLRITNGKASFLARQFALEYAGQFEVVLPALARIGAPFPLGGTSNHFRVPTLHRAGGWDPFNVTEDADLGFRLARMGCKGGVLRHPTYEDAPVDLYDWLPQRTRWIKGYMQTWGVHTRRVGGEGLRVAIAMQLSIGFGILGAAFHGPFVMLIAAKALIDICGGAIPRFGLLDMALLIGAWLAAAVVKWTGARRAGLTMRVGDALAAPLYWPLQSLAFLFALGQLVRDPYHWDKTDHVPHGADETVVGLDDAARAGVSRAA